MLRRNNRKKILIKISLARIPTSPRAREEKLKTKIKKKKERKRNRYNEPIPLTTKKENKNNAAATDILRPLQHDEQIIISEGFAAANPARRNFQHLRFNFHLHVARPPSLSCKQKINE